MLPILFELSGLKVYSYPLLMGLAWGIAYQLALYNLNKYKLSEQGVAGLFFGAFVSAWIGAKVFFLMVSSGEYQQLYVSSANFWLGGGFVFYGGLIFGLIFLFIYTKYLKRFPFENCYVFLPSILVGHAVGRLGCFLAGCCYGSSSNVPWAVHMHAMNRHPVQLYEAAGLFVIYFMVNKLMAKNVSTRYLISFYIITYGLLRFVAEMFRGDGIRGVYFEAISTSQAVSLGLVSGTAILLLVSSLRRSSL